MGQVVKNTSNEVKFYNNELGQQIPWYGKETIDEVGNIVTPPLTYMAYVTGSGIVPTGTLPISENGTFNISGYEFVKVNVSQGQGILTVVSNGEYDCGKYAYVNVQVPTTQVDFSGMDKQTYTEYTSKGDYVLRDSYKTISFVADDDTLKLYDVQEAQQRYGWTFEGGEESTEQLQDIDVHSMKSVTRIVSPTNTSDNIILITKNDANVTWSTSVGEESSRPVHRNPDSTWIYLLGDIADVCTITFDKATEVYMVGYLGK